KVICPTEVFSVETLCPLNDSDYLVGGIFRQFQGYERGSIAKIDKNGFLDTTVFNEAGFDSSHWSSSKGLVTLIKPAKNNKYYIGGQFKYFNGQRVSSVIRINGNQEFSIDNPEVSSLQLFPNPANDKLTINASTIIDEIEIYNISGCLLQKTKINKTNVSLDVSALPVGNFLLRATSNDEVFVKKFVVLR
ncbi:MAG: T9SS type A sorting domain-containing protein, partial [Bacteroidota bacterium]|nr:T9SS type A sorting domain-containing protein [Bacteroidota bacterium]